MTPTEVDIVLENIKYRPWHTLTWDWLDDRLVSIYWEYVRPDSRRPSVREIAYSGDVLLDIERADEESLVRAVWGMTQRLDWHESAEFFMYGDQRPFDPHAKLIRPLLGSDSRPTEPAATVYDPSNSYPVVSGLT